MRLDWTTVQHDGKRLRRLRAALARQASAAFPSRSGTLLGHASDSQRPIRAGTEVGDANAGPEDRANAHKRAGLRSGAWLRWLGTGRPGVVLVDGRSSQMGTAKADWNGTVPPCFAALSACSPVRLKGRCWSSVAPANHCVMVTPSPAVDFDDRLKLRARPDVLAWPAAVVVTAGKRADRADSD